MPEYLASGWKFSFLEISSKANTQRFYMCYVALAFVGLVFYVIVLEKVDHNNFGFCWITVERKYSPLFLFPYISGPVGLGVTLSHKISFRGVFLSLENSYLTFNSMLTCITLMRKFLSQCNLLFAVQMSVIHQYLSQYKFQTDSLEADNIRRMGSS